MTSADADRVERTRRAFERFGRVEATAQHSPIYEQLSALVASDTDLATLAAEARPGQPAPNLFFASVHALLLAGTEHALAAYYPSVGGGRPPDPGLDAAFRDFVAAHADPLRVLLHTRLVQTNEPRRCACLLPVFRAISDDAAIHAGGAPLALVEIGPAAGLNLLFDRYAYDYAGTPAGDPTSPLRLSVEMRGGLPSVAPVPTVVSRTGIDLNALDVRDERDVRWLEALTWPEHDERRRVLRAAITVAQQDPPRVVSGDLFELLPDALVSAPREAAVTLVATFVLNQFNTEMRDRLRNIVLDASRRRPIWCVLMSADAWVGQPPAPDGAMNLWLVRVGNGEGIAQRLAVADPHGWWMDWDPGPGIAWPPDRFFG